MSFLHDGTIYITASGSCFGSLTKDSFAVVTLQGDVIGEKQASKELPLHKILYEKDDTVAAVIHTHSFYSTLWSCLHHQNTRDSIPRYTPYLAMLVGTIGLIPYAQPGSEELFRCFAERVKLSDGYLLQNHGPIIGAKDLLSAFYGLEELEESARLAWVLKDEMNILPLDKK
jgi:ribulose-5-phosphate 4-epimerase/fuculose-1-phosphate aldolase